MTEAATAAVLEAVEKFAQGDFTPMPLDYANPGALYALSGRASSVRS
ncbi:MAG: hypothetical protein M5R42_18160 [Rhodocyclaceae bacterium]|nr:hypothetical protein [Rhodocyclaceae bacterium]